MIRRLFLLLALTGLLVGNSAVLSWAAGLGLDSCTCDSHVESGSESGSESGLETGCCMPDQAQTAASCCPSEEPEIPEGTPRWTEACSCGNHAPRPSLTGGGPQVSVRDRASGPVPPESTPPSVNEAAIHGRGNAAPEPPPPRA